MDAGFHPHQLSALLCSGGGSVLEERTVTGLSEGWREEQTGCGFFFPAPEGSGPLLRARGFIFVRIEQDVDRHSSPSQTKKR